MSAREAKIGYRTLGGYMSTAYVTCDDEAMTAEGINKHSDEPVFARWDEALQEWVETPTCPPPPVTPARSGTPAPPTPAKPADGRTEPQGENA